ncbi:phospho-sugar mutase [Planifilum fimeticola]
MNEHYRRWMEFEDLDPALKSELASLTDEEEILDRFDGHLTFGTAGLRGKIGAGTNRMNRYTIRRATEGFARYLLKCADNPRRKGIAIAYDSRRFSRTFAEEAAGVLANHGIPVRLFRKMRPTPVLSFAVRHLKAAGGIMITASHNPPEYNGYKVYGPDGGQIPPRTSRLILEEILRVRDELSIPAMPLEDGLASGLIRLLGEELDQDYHRHLRGISLQPGTGKRIGDSLRIVYTPLHGTGSGPVRRALSEWGFSRVFTVAEQEVPDPDFPTVSTPNPEEAQAFRLALERAQEVDADLAVATDPDADRLGLAVKQPSGRWSLLTGNQVGALLLHYILSQRKAKEDLPENGVVIQSIVTSDFGRSIAASYGVATVETLTGFKYIGEKIGEYERSGTHEFLFGYEESCGYLIGAFVRDKDAVQAAALTCEMAAFHRLEGRSLWEVLEELYRVHGHYRESVLPVTLNGNEGRKTVALILDRLRHAPPQQIGDIGVAEIKDYARGIDGLPPAEVIKCLLADGSWVAVRPSGTEPKMKWYLNAVDRDPATADEKLEGMKNFISRWMDALR